MHDGFKQLFTSLTRLDERAAVVDGRWDVSPRGVRGVEGRLVAGIGCMHGWEGIVY